MTAEQIDYSGQAIADMNIKVRGIEERQKILKDQILLLGQNLVEIKEKANQRTIEIKKELENLKQSTERLNSFMDMISNEFSKFAKKEDLEILTKQAKMFQPLDYLQKESI